MAQTFKTLVVHQDMDGQYIRQIEERSLAGLPEYDVLIHVRCFSPNYKDALSATGHKGVTSKVPPTPGTERFFEGRRIGRPVVNLKG